MAAERILIVENRLMEAESRLAEVLGKMTTVQESVLGLGERVEGTVSHQQKLAAELTAYTGSLANEKTQFTKDVNAAFDEHKAALQAVVNHARDEFLKIKSGVAGLHDNTAQAFLEVKAKVELLEAELHQRSGGNANNAGGTGPSHQKGFLPMKSLVPAVFGSVEDQWRSWQEDIADYLDTVRPGMKRFLKVAEQESGAMNTQWLTDQLAVHPADVVGEKANVYRTLKALTTGEARTVVQGVRDEDGFMAWRALHLRFGPSVAARQGKVMCDLTQMVARPAKSPSETRTLVTELERRVRIAEDVTGESLGDSHLKSILASILDPTTRAHTSTFQGIGTGYQELKRAVLEFTNNNIVNTKTDAGDPMNIGACSSQAASACEAEAPPEDSWEFVGDHLAAVTANTQCFQCGGFGHLAHSCPTPKGKGKGKAGSKGGKGDNAKGQTKGAVKGSIKGGLKGARKGPANGCWTCGGSHFASECPHSGGQVKGGKGKGFHMIDQWWPEPSVRPLCTLQAVALTELPPRRVEPATLPGKKIEQPIAVRNRFQALEENDEELRVTTGRTLADFMPALPSVSSARQPKQQQQQRQKQKASMPGRLCPLITIEPEGLQKVGEAPQWEEIELAVDSGASETVIPEDTVRAAELVPSEASRRGVEYEVANGARIPNLGQKAFQAVTHEEGIVRSITAQVCDVNKPLLSVHKLVQSGNTVVFSRDGAYVEDDTTKDRMYLREKGGMYMLRLWIPAEGF